MKGILWRQQATLHQSFIFIVNGHIKRPQETANEKHNMKGDLCRMSKGVRATHKHDIVYTSQPQLIEAGYDAPIGNKNHSNVTTCHTQITI